MGGNLANYTWVDILRCVVYRTIQICVDKWVAVELNHDQNMVLACYNGNVFWVTTVDRVN